MITFTDVLLTNAHYQGIQYVASKNLTTGYPDGTFRPNNNLTRGQMATFLFRASGNDPATSPSVNADKLDSRDAGQLVAAGIHVVRDRGNAPVISKWFNNVNGVAPTIAGSGGSYLIDVGFATHERFVVVTVDENFIDTRDAFATAYTPSGTNQVRAEIHDASVGGEAAAEFYLMIF